MTIKLGHDEFLAFITLAAFLKWDSSIEFSPIENYLWVCFLILVKDAAV